MKSSFTIEEIADALRSFDVEPELIEDPDEPGFTFMEAALNELSLTIFPHGSGPFHESATFLAFAPVEDDPVNWAHAWNEDGHWTTAVALLDMDGTPIIDDDGEATVSIQRKMSFYGGIHPDALRSMVGQCLFDFVQMYGLDDDDQDQSDDLLDDSLEDAAIPSDGDLGDALIAFLKRNGDQTARQLATEMCLPKFMINSILYGRPDLFQRQQGSPPRWNVK